MTQPLAARIGPGANGRAIEAGIENAIADGGLSPGSRLPTVRVLASQLAVSPTTVAAAYRELRSRGLVATDGRRGTTVARRPPLRVRPGAAPPPGVRDLWSGNPSRSLLPSLPRALARVSTRHTLYGDAAKLPELAELASTAFRADGVEGELAIVGGALDGIERVLQAQLRPGDRVAVEDPSWPRIADLLYALRLDVVPVPLDEHGPRPEALDRALRRDVRALICTPRGQNPTGAALDGRRGSALRAVLRRHPDVLVVEDDYLGAVAGASYHGLHGATRRWALIRSLSKVLGPDLRLAALAADALTVSQVEGRQLLGTGWVSHILQQAAAALWRDALESGLLARAERAYAERRGALLRALGQHGVASTGRTGLGVWVPVPEEVAIAQRLLEHGLAVSPGERYRFATGPAIRITTSELEPSEAPDVARAVAAALEASGATYPA